jgi:hypothetical protein
MLTTNELLEPLRFFRVILFLLQCRGQHEECLLNSTDSHSNFSISRGNFIETKPQHIEK